MELAFNLKMSKELIGLLILKQYIWTITILYMDIFCHFVKIASLQKKSHKKLFKALKHIKSFRGECKLSTWLCQIAKNTYYTMKTQQERQIDYPLENIESETTLEQKIIDNDIALQLHRLLHALDEPYKEVFWMRTFGDLSFKEIGQIFNKTESWARVTYHRAKMKIKESVK